MARHFIRATSDKELSGEYLERGTESGFRYRDFDDLGKSRQKILTLIAERIRAEAASSEYQKVAAQNVDRVKIKSRTRSAPINFRA